MEIKDLTGLSKPLTRLVEVIAQGIGAVSYPYLLKRNAAAKAMEISAIAEALDRAAEKHGFEVQYKDGAIESVKRSSQEILIAGETSPEDRVANRTKFQEQKRQKNLEGVTSAAAAELAYEETVADECPDEDWVSRFFASAQDVSSEEMQNLWGRILAGEIKQPGTYSLRTLEFVRNLTRVDAELIDKIGKFALFYGPTAFIPAHDKAALEGRGIFQGHHFSLGELGVIYPTDLQLRLFREDDKKQEALLSGQLLLLVSRGEINNEVQLQIWKFTAIGKELLNLLQPAEDVGLLEAVAAHFVKKKGYAELANVIEHQSDGNIRYQTLRKGFGEDNEAESSPT